MTDYELKQIFAKNLNHYLAHSGESQAEVAQILGVSKSTFSSWSNAKKTPRMDKLEALAKHFGIKKSDLIESKQQQNNKIEPQDLARLTETILTQIEHSPQILLDGEIATPEAITLYKCSLLDGIRNARLVNNNSQ